MTLPALPKQTGDFKLDIQSVFLYLQRIRDQLPQTISEATPGQGGSTFTVEDAQDAVGNGFQSTATVNAIYDDVNGTFHWDVKPATTLGTVEVALNNTLIGTRKRIDFIPLSHNQFTVNDSAGQNEVQVGIAPVTYRLVGIGEELSLPDESCLIVQNYFKVQGRLLLTGNSSLRIL